MSVAGKTGSRRTIRSPAGPDSHSHFYNTSFTYIHTYALLYNKTNHYSITSFKFHPNPNSKTYWESLL